MNIVELTARRTLVREFIKADPVFIQVDRKSEAVKTASGGYVPGLIDDLEPQEARIVQNKRRYNNGIVNAEAGDLPHTDYLLLAEHTRNFEVNDEFKWLGENYKITGKFVARRESILCSIDLLGADNRA